jgi:chemotaxis protein methyltransferase CheR
VSAGTPPAAPADASQLELELLLLGLEQAYAADFRFCPRPLAAEAVADLLAVRRLPSTAALLHETLRDPHLGRQAIAMLEASKLALFGDLAFFEVLRRRILPWLRTYPFVTVWAVQCGDASDLYSTAILLEEAGLLSRSQIYATEPDPERLSCAQAGSLAAASVRFAQHNYRKLGGTGAFDSYIERSGATVSIARRLRRAIVWGQFSLEAGYSFNEFNLILCRNGLGGLAGNALPAALQVMTRSLSLSGLLALGRDDLPAARLLSPCFREWSGAVHVHQRIC